MIIIIIHGFEGLLTLLTERLTYTDTRETGIFVMIKLFFVDFSFLTEFCISAKIFRFQKKQNNVLLFKPAHLGSFDNFHKCYKYSFQSSKLLQCFAYYIFIKTNSLTL